MTFLRSRRDADELHDALTAVVTPEVAQRHADLLHTVALLQAVEPVRPRPDFSADLRERLMAAAATELVATPVRTAPTVVSPAPSPVRRRLGTVAASLVIVGGTAGMAAAAQGALPGDPLYPLKRGGEQVVATVTPGAADLGRAQTRLEEAEQLQARGADTDLVVRTIDEFRAFGERGAQEAFAAYRGDGDDQAVEAVRELSSTGVPRLDALAADDPGVASAAGEAAGLLQALDDQARQLCAACGTTEALSLPESLDTALGQAGGAATLSSLLSAPAEQARMDRRALAGLDTSQVQALVEAAETEAGRTPAQLPVPAGKDWPTVAPSARGAVSSTLVTAGQATGEVVRGTTGAVDDLVGGLRDGVGTTTKTLLPQEGLTGALTDTVDQALAGVSGVTGTLAGN